MLNIKNNIESVENYLNDLQESVNNKNVYQKAEEFSQLLKLNSVLFSANRYAQNALHSITLINIKATLKDMYEISHDANLRNEYGISSTDVNVLQFQARMLKNELNKDHFLAVSTLHPSDSDLHVCGVYPITVKNFKDIINWTRKGLSIVNDRGLIEA